MEKVLFLPKGKTVDFITIGDLPPKLKKLALNYISDMDMSLDDKLSLTISGAFFWDQTLEGADFWDIVNKGFIPEKEYIEDEDRIILKMNLKF